MHAINGSARLLGLGCLLLVACSGPYDPAENVEHVEQVQSALGTLNVLTRNYDNQRTGANLSETQLTTANVNPSQFGRAFQLSVDDQLYAQLLYASGVSIAGATHNVVYAATVNNSVFAFDADSAGPPLWQHNFNGAGRPVANTDVGQACGTYQDFSGNIGIVGTPVIDGAAGTMYFVVRTVEGSSFVQRLHAIDITTGNERQPSPVVIAASGFTRRRRTSGLPWGSPAASSTSPGPRTATPRHTTGG